MKKIFLLSIIALLIGASSFAQPRHHKPMHKHHRHHKHHHHMVSHNNGH